MLDGPTHCTNCHVGGGGDHKLKCLSCHVEIRQRLATGQGLHPSLLGKGNPEDQCAKCHAEHNGENFALIRWEGRLEDFDHRKTGYALEGAHAGLACAKCHNPERIPASSRQEIRIKDLRRTYLGLSRQCAACHRDEHRGQLGLACEKCHAISKWKEGAKFDHSSTKFPLAGAHAQAPCQKCHPAEASRDGGKPSVKYAGIAFAQCTACHKDVHQGAFPAPCISCHTESAWKPVRNLTTSFDHSKTKFPLMGKHAALACEKCHRTSDFHAPIAHDRCDGCHKDVHGGQFAARVDRGDCAACHTVEGWKPSTFNAAAHAATAYPLLGKHSALACATCHKPAGAATVYRIRFALCTDCHSDPHQGQLAKSACSDCHDVGGFRPANFALARHEQTSFPLRGAHVAVACGECHLRHPERPGVVAYRFADLSCTGCHSDPHGGQFKERMAATAEPGGASQGCVACHNQNTWHDASKFDHSTTRFALTGAHRITACERCHGATSLSGNLRKAVYRGTPVECASCHEDIHGGQFASATGATVCADCHTTARWRPSTFDHSRTRFALTGAHADVRCRECHTATSEVAGKSVLIYKKTPLECSGCHGTTVAK